MRPIFRRLAVAAGLVAPLIATSGAGAEGLTVLPVSIQMAPGQMATTLTVRNEGDSATSVQVRPFLWSQTARGEDQLRPAVELLASPPIATIPAGATQVVRLVLRRPAVGREATYRILLDQIPPPAAPGTVRIALRLSIPVFAEPAARAVPHVQWRIVEATGALYLEAVNDGGRHEKIRGLTLIGAGEGFRIEANLSPYILPGATRRWRIAAAGAPPPPGAILRLTGEADSGAIDQPVAVVGGP